jgi:hypothetical protein
MRGASMKRRLLNLATAASLTICLALLAMMAVSYWWAMAFERRESMRDDSAGISRGVISYTRLIALTSDAALPYPLGWSVTSYEADDYAYRMRASGGESWAGFGFLQTTFQFGGGSKNHYTCIMIPAWFPAAIAAALPVWRLHLWRRRAARSRDGRCPACGYDLRATPDRCPECGATP